MGSPEGSDPRTHAGHRQPGRRGAFRYGNPRAWTLDATISRFERI